MTKGDPKDVVRSLVVDDLNTGDAEAAGRIVAPDFFDHTNPPDLQRGLEGHLGIVRYFHGAFSDLRWDIEDLFAEGDRVCVRLTMHGRQTGEFFGVPATGRTVEVSGTHVLRVRDGKVVEHWGNNDDMGLMRQLGALPGGEGGEA
jgi:steroid delta-isomerase-like uncharacterized protein